MGGRGLERRLSGFKLMVGAGLSPPMDVVKGEMSSSFCDTHTHTLHLKSTKEMDEVTSP